MLETERRRRKWIEKDDAMVMKTMMMKTMMMIIFLVYQSKSISSSSRRRRKVTLDVHDHHHLDTKPYLLKSFRRMLRLSRTRPPVLWTATSDLPSLPAARRPSTKCGGRAVPSQLLRRPRAVLACGLKRLTSNRWTPGRVGRWVQP